MIEISLSKELNLHPVVLLQRKANKLFHKDVGKFPFATNTLQDVKRESIVGLKFGCTTFYPREMAEITHPPDLGFYIARKRTFVLALKRT